MKLKQNKVKGVACTNAVITCALDISPLDTTPITKCKYCAV